MLTMSKLQTMRAAISDIVPHGASVAMGLQMEQMIPFAAGHEIIRQKRRGLTLIGPISDMAFDQLAIAHRFKAFRNGDSDFSRLPLVRLIDARNPVPVSRGFALAPDQERRVRVGLRRGCQHHSPSECRAELRWHRQPVLRV